MMKHEQQEASFTITDNMWGISVVVHMPAKGSKCDRSVTLIPKARAQGTKFHFEKSSIGTIRAVARMMLRACEIAEAVRPTEIVMAEEDKSS
jgi:hypothetical protein